jgi:predicted DNA-binding transcriptional regulator YafY
MLQTSARLLRLLSLLQARADWSGQELAERLGVTTRTVRNDVERLRSLGYPVHASPGVGGGYRLGAGAALPPLLLDDEEAVAVAVGLRTAAAGSVTGIQETSLRALAKLEQVLPSRLRHRVNALQTATVELPTPGPTVDPEVLTAIAGACRDHQRLRFDYRDHPGSPSVRSVEPHRLAHDRGRWYLVAWDADRQDWRTFRADRIQPRTPTGPRFTPRDPPGGDVATYLLRGVGAAMWRYRARVRVHAPATQVAGRLPPAVVVEAVDDHTCIVNVGSDTPQMLAVYLGMLDVDFEAVEPPELVEQLRTLADRYRRAITGLRQDPSREGQTGRG